MIYMKKTMRIIGYILGSEWTTALVLGLMAFAYALAGVWGDPVALLRLFLKQNPIGLALCLLLIANLLTTIVKSTRDIYGHGHPSAEQVRGMDDHIVVRDRSFAPDKWMLSKGLSLKKTENGFISHKGRFSFVPGLMLKAGLLVILVALPISGSLRQSTDVLMSTGISGQGDPSDLQNQRAQVLGHEIRLLRLDAALPTDFMLLATESKGTSLELSGLEAALDVDGKKITLHQGTPQSTGGVGGLNMRIKYLGYRMRIRSSPPDKPGTLAFLDALPPGRECEPVSGVAVRLLPERSVKKGLLSGSLYDLTNPIFSIITPEGQYALRAGETSEDGEVALGQSSLYIELEVRRDAALPFIRAGLFMFSLGLLLMPLRMFWYEMRVVAVLDGDSVVLGSSDEFFKAWGIERFREWTEELVASKDLENSPNEKP